MATKIDSRKNVNKGMKALKNAAQTLNACLKAVNYALGNDHESDKNATDALLCTALKGVDLQTLLQVMGVDYKGGLTVKKLRGFWTANTVVTGKKDDGSDIVSLAMYRNRAIYTTDGLRVYVRDSKDEITPLSVWCIQPIGDNEWTVSNFVRGIEQNYLPKREQARAIKSKSDAQLHSAYYVKMDGAFIECSFDDIEF